MSFRAMVGLILNEGKLRWKELVDELLSKTVVRWPGFEPGLAAWQAAVLDQTRLPPLCCR